MQLYIPELDWRQDKPAISGLVNFSSHVCNVSMVDEDQDCLFRSAHKSCSCWE